MAELPTVEIVSLKNPNEMWRINADDFDPTKHTRWDQRQEQQPAPETPADAGAAPETPASVGAAPKAEGTLPPAEAGAGARKR
jgi:hypothetical protein